MSYYIFFSYSRVLSKEAYLQQFFDDLAAEVTQRVDPTKGIKIYFYDEEDVELGRDWKAAIADALQTSRVMVPIYSPPYFTSEYCGKEWQFFQMRREEYLRQKRGPELPPVIKPVLWLPLPPDLRAAIDESPPISDTQYTIGRKEDIFNQKGLRYVLKKKERFKDEYTDYVEKLADEIVEAAKAYDLPALARTPPLADVIPPPPFPNCVNIEGEPQTPTFELPQHVRFVFIAADPDKFGGLRSPDPYRRKGGREWKPYYPEPANDIYPLVQHIVSGGDLGFSSDELPFDTNLMIEVEKARDEGKIVILLVDSWTVNWDDATRRLLQAFDQRNYLNCSVLLPWNEKDTDTVILREQIERTLRTTFHFSRMKTPVHYREAITNKDDLTAALHDILTRIRAAIRDFAEVQRPVHSGYAKPIVSGPGGAPPPPASAPTNP